jgi:hypothetical protein
MVTNDLELHLQFDSIHIRSGPFRHCNDWPGGRGVRIRHREGKQVQSQIVVALRIELPDLSNIIQSSSRVSKQKLTM